MGYVAGLLLTFNTATALAVLAHRGWTRAQRSLKEMLS